MADLENALAFLDQCAMNRIRTDAPTVYVGGELARAVDKKKPATWRLSLGMGPNPITPSLVTAVAALGVLDAETLATLERLAKLSMASQLSAAYYGMEAADAAFLIACLVEASRRCWCRDQQRARAYKRKRSPVQPRKKKKQI